MVEERLASGGLSRRRSTIVRVRPTLRGVAVAGILVVLAVAEAITPHSGLLLIALALAIPLVAAPFLTLSRGLRARTARIGIMVAPPLVPVGGSCQLFVQLANEGDSALPSLFLDKPTEHSDPRAIPTRARLHLAVSPSRLLRWEALGAHQCGSAVLSVPTTRRGVFVIGPLRLWAHDPFGLFGVAVASASPVRVVVHPPLAPTAAPHVGRAGSTSNAMSQGGDARMHSDDPGGEWSGLRPYVPGDRLHLLSWPAEALYGTLLVHEFRPDGNNRIRILLDDRVGVHRRLAFEEALSTVHGVMVDAAAQALEIDLATFSGARSIGMPTPEGMVELLTFLARAQPRKGRRATGPNPSDVAVTGPSVVVTTSTALPTLPPLPGQSSVLVAE